MEYRYYVAAVKKNNSPNGKPILAKGKLVDKCRNVIYKNSGPDIINKGYKRKISHELITANKVLITESDRKVLDWLNDPNNKIEDILENWKGTFHLRQTSAEESVHAFWKSSLFCEKQISKHLTKFEINVFKKVVVLD